MVAGDRNDAFTQAVESFLTEEVPQRIHFCLEGIPNQGDLMSDRVQLTIENGIADVRLNRPEKMNALDHAMFAGLIETAAQTRG